jgi:hypothetical protein
MTVAVLLPFLISVFGTLWSLNSYWLNEPGDTRSAMAFRLSFLQDGFALIACVATLRRTKRYWLSAMASVLTLTSWFWLSVTMLPMGLVFLGTVASIGIGIWSFVVIRKPEVRYGFSSQFDPVDRLGQLVLPRFPNIVPTPSNISRMSVISLLGLCLVGILIGGALHVHDDHIRTLDAEREAKKNEEERLANKTKRIQELKEKVQTALTQFDVNKDMAADTLFGAWDHNTGYYGEALDGMVGELTIDQQQKLFQLKEMIKPRVEKKLAEGEEVLRQWREEREKREASKQEPSGESSSGGWFGGGRKVYGTWRDLQNVVRGKSQQEVVAILGKPSSIYSNGTLADHSDDEVWTYYDILRHPVTGQAQTADVHFARGTCTDVTDR